MRGNKDPDPKLLLSFSEDQQLWQRDHVLIVKLYREFHNHCLLMHVKLIICQMHCKLLFLNLVYPIQ